MFDRLADLVSEHAELEHALADPAVHSDQEKARTLGRRYAELTPIVHAYREWQQTSEDEEAARELAREDSSFAAEAEQLAAHRTELEAQLQKLLVPRDPNDNRDIILEVKAGEGGDESALFAGDLLRMYQRYAERRGWKTEILDSTVTGLGGIKDATVVVKGKGTDGAWSRLKYEGGVHRVQRVPVTESQGRIHTSAAGVLVAPEADPVEVQVNDNDLKIDVFRSSGPGGQSVNTTDSAVRITHLPTGIVVSCQNEKSQLQNKEQAMRVLRARLLAEAEAEADAKASAERRSQVRTVDRSERVRTYNFPENRISDHRVNYKAYNLDQVIDGDLDGVIDALAAADLEAKLAGPGALAMMSLLLDEVALAAARLAEAGVESPRADAELIAASVHNVRRGELHMVRDCEFDGRFWADVARRAAREPLQHITGRAHFRYLELEVGPGVFVPRPETEVMTGWAISRLGEMDVAEPLVTDLGTGSGAIALAIGQEVPRARVHAVEADPLARAWAERNVSKYAESVPYMAGRVMVHAGDFAGALTDLDGTVDLVISNPPYIPVGAYVEPEVSEYDPPAALWSGTDGLDAIRALERTARRLLRPGGLLAVEHGAPQGAAVYWVFPEESGWRDTRNHKDLAGRDRFVTATWGPATEAGEEPDEQAF